MKKVSLREVIDPDSPEGIQASLDADEEERKHRDRQRVKRCPICGLRPEIPPINEGRHIYVFYCEKCQARFMIHVVGKEPNL